MSQASIAPFRSRLPTLLPWLVRLTLGFTITEAAVGLATWSPAFLASTGMTSGFLVVLLGARYVARSGEEMRATWLVAGGLGVLAVVAGYAIGDVGQAMLLLPVLAFALILPFATGPHVRGIIALAVLDSVAVLVALQADHPLALPEPIAGVFSSAILVAVAALIVLALLDFAASARRSLADIVVMHEHQRHRAEDQAAVLRLLGALGSVTEIESGAAPELIADRIVATLGRLPKLDLVEILLLEDGDLRLLAVKAPEAFGLHVGESLPPARTAAILGRASLGIWSETVVPDTGPGALPIELIGIRAAAFAPLRVGGVLLGVLGIGTADPHHAEHIISEIPAVGEFGAAAVALLGPHLVARREGRRVGEEVAAIIEQRAHRSVFQPIVDLRSGIAVGYEALTTFKDGRSPAEVFSMAERHGHGRLLEMATLRASIRSSDRLPSGAFLSLNVSPDLALDPALGLLLSRVRRPIVLEITEHVVIADYPSLRAAARSLGPNVSLAVDDAGAGIANFNHLVELRPAYIKVDIGLVRDVDVDLPRQALLVGLLHFANESGCAVVAEGLETSAERDTVVRLGISLGQGYFLGRPAAAGSWTADSVATPGGVATLVRPVRRGTRTSIFKPTERRTGATPVNSGHSHAQPVMQHAGAQH